MEKLLPVERSFSPYGYVLDNLAAMRTEYLGEAERLRGSGAAGFGRLQRLLTTVEVLMSLRDGFRRNGWDDGADAGGADGKGTRILAKRG